MTTIATSGAVVTPTSSDSISDLCTLWETSLKMKHQQHQQHQQHPYSQSHYGIEDTNTSHEPSVTYSFRHNEQGVASNVAHDDQKALLQSSSSSSILNMPRKIDQLILLKGDSRGQQDFEDDTSVQYDHDHDDYDADSDVEHNDQIDSVNQFKLPSLVDRTSLVQTRYTGRPMILKQHQDAKQDDGIVMFSTGTLKSRERSNKRNTSSSYNDDEDDEASDASDLSDDSGFDSDSDDNTDSEAENEYFEMLGVSKPRPISHSNVNSNGGAKSFLQASSLQYDDYAVTNGHITFDSTITCSSIVSGYHHDGNANNYFNTIIACGLESGHVAFTHYSTENWREASQYDSDDVSGCLRKLMEVNLHGYNNGDGDSYAIRDLAHCRTMNGHFASAGSDSTLRLWDINVLSNTKRRDDLHAQATPAYITTYAPKPTSILNLHQHEVVTAIDWYSDALVSCTIDLLPEDAHHNAHSEASAAAATATAISNQTTQSYSQSPVWSEGARYALYDNRTKLSATRPALSMATHRRGLLCVQHINDWEVLLGFESGHILSLDLRSLDVSEQASKDLKQGATTMQSFSSTLIQDPYVQAIGTIDVNPSCTRFVTAGLNNTTIWSEYQPDQASSNVHSHNHAQEARITSQFAPVYHGNGDSIDVTDSEEFLITHGVFIDDNSCMTTNHHGAVTMIRF